MFTPRKPSSASPPRALLFAIPFLLFLPQFSVPSTPVVIRHVKFCDHPGACVFDVGLNTGQDTGRYLERKDARVVAVEADPTLVEKARDKFRGAVTEGRLELLAVGLVGNKSESGRKLSFWVNTHNNRFSSFKQQTGCRSPRGDFLPEGNMTYCRKMELPTMSCEQLVDRFGTPEYMKVDIEGMDRACLQSLGNLAWKDRPTYASKENVFKYDIEMFARLGYTQFKVVNQAVLNNGLWGDEEGHSGPWGDEAEDVWTGKRWQSAQELANRLPLPSSVVIKGKEVRGWYDLHAKKV